MAVAVINRNTCGHLRACLKTIEQEGPPELIVVDNASTDDSAAMVREEHPWARLYTNGLNPGYGAAANQAIYGARSPYVLLLNSDTQLLPGSLRELSNYLDEHPQAAVAGPRLHNPDGSLQPSCYPFPTPLHFFLQESTLGRAVNYVPVLKDHYLRTWSHREARAVPWVLGAALAIRREAFIQVGGFDESFFMWAEEVDLCYRLQFAGWQTHFTPCATIVHIGGASTKQQRAEMAVQYFVSMGHFYRKHYSALRYQQLQVITKGIVLARWLRDQARYRRVSDPDQRMVISANMLAWRHILTGSNDGAGVAKDRWYGQDG